MNPQEEFYLEINKNINYINYEYEYICVGYIDCTDETYFCTDMK